MAKINCTGGPFKVKGLRYNIGKEFIKKTGKYFFNKIELNKIIRLRGLIPFSALVSGFLSDFFNADLKSCCAEKRAGNDSFVLFL